MYDKYGKNTCYRIAAGVYDDINYYKKTPNIKIIEFEDILL